MTQPDWRPVDFDGLVVEAADGARLLAIPTAVLEVLRYAHIIRFRRGTELHSLRLGAFAERLQEQDEHTPPLPQRAANTPSPTPPPAPGDPLDPANIPLRTFRDGGWQTIYVTRDEYERYTRQGNQPNEGTEK